jgi:hypothetical protein
MWSSVAALRGPVSTPRPLYRNHVLPHVPTQVGRELEGAGTQHQNTKHPPNSHKMTQHPTN